MLCVALTFLYCALVTVATAHAQPKWPYQSRQGQFYIYADFPLADVLPALEELSKLRLEIERVLHLKMEASPVEVYLFNDKQAYYDYLADHLPKIPKRQALFVKIGSQGMIFAHQGPDLAEDLRHESTHSLLNATLKQVPLWLDEGLAEYFEVPRPRQASGHSHLKAIRLETKVRGIGDLRTIERTTEVASMRKADYRACWAWTHFLLHGPPKARRLFQQYIQELRSGPGEESLAQRIYEQQPDIDDIVRHHFRTWKE